ncbi:AHH domain-containing protein [Bacillus toyonensis]|uniref:AHH domain-containing protein n=1 Tax=Bacillus toyonensis TaxID=155322 RepID=UPI000BED6E6D|nr:AHH domain-containing protein [Bacillus toyonensis]PDZ25452.1 cytoplasmic protein [Bacillus toyonensis]PFY25191.1 cytoplasmic protein [Bacillus toyonensis]PHG44662.1 cytoplasmic protein [Bacillus toyonensis]
MSLNMYLGEVQNQTQSMNAVCTATIQGMEQAIQSIDAFAIDTVLQGQTYDSAKAFFTETFRPLAQGIIYLCEELIRQNDAFPSQFQSQVASTDVIEQEILEQIREIDRMKASMEAISQTMPIPGMDAMANLFFAMRRKLQEKLNHLYEFNQTTSNNYATAIQLASSIASGLAEVQSGKGFSPASGTFSTQGLNMEWADSIHEYLDTNIRLDNRIKSADIVESDKLQDSTSEKNMAEGKNMLEKVVSGVWNGSGQFIGGIVEFFDSLDDTVAKENLKYAAGHPIETAYTMVNTFSDKFMTEFWHGDAESRTQWGTSIFMELGLGRIGGKGISKVTTLENGASVAKFSEGISHFTNNLPLKDRFAFVGASGFGSTQIKTFEALQEARDTFMFAKTGGRSRVKDVQEVIQDYADKVLDRVNVKNDYPDSYTASKVLREELKAAGIEPPPYSNAAHHLTPWNDKRAIEAQELLKEFEIHHDSAANGVFLPYKVNEYVTTEVLHIGNHGTDYMKEVTKVLKEVKEYGGTQADAVAALHDLRTRLLDGSLKLNNPK